MQNQKGFTLIELMIVIAIIAILAAIALPAYQNYVARSQVSEAISLASSFKTPVGLYVTEEGVCPDSSVTGGLPEEFKGLTAGVGTYVDAISITGDEATGKCTITATMGADANAKLDGGSISLVSSPIAKRSGGTDGSGIDDSGTETSAVTKWTCESTIAASYLPKSCKA